MCVCVCVTHARACVYLLLKVKIVLWLFTCYTDRTVTANTLCFCFVQNLIVLELMQHGDLKSYLNDLDTRCVQMCVCAVSVIICVQVCVCIQYFASVCACVHSLTHCIRVHACVHSRSAYTSIHSLMQTSTHSQN